MTRLFLYVLVRDDHELESVNYYYPLGWPMAWVLTSCLLSYIDFGNEQYAKGQLQLHILCSVSSA